MTGGEGDGCAHNGHDYDCPDARLQQAGAGRGGAKRARCPLRRAVAGEPLKPHHQIISVFYVSSD